MSGASTPLVAPDMWCRRIFAALGQRKASDRIVGHLEMLLAYFIEQKPAPETFGDVLARHAADSRADIASAARVLLHAWQQGYGGPDDIALPPLCETLRILGARLDDTGIRAAYIVLTPERAQLQTFGELSESVLGPLDVRLEIAARMALRGEVDAPDPEERMTNETRLRVVGTHLDRESVQSFELFVTPRTVVVEGDGYHQYWTLDDVLALLADTSDALAAVRPDTPKRARRRRGGELATTDQARASAR